MANTFNVCVTCSLRLVAQTLPKCKHGKEI